jgi:subtilisin family serine protease
MEAMAFDYAVAAGAAVINNSWGPDGIPWPLPPIVEASFLNATASGRGGLGTVIVWAAGNGSEPIDSDGYASSPLTIAVGASTDYDLHASYSDYGPELDVVAPSSGGNSSITSTSTNSFGASLYTTAFGGTSAAAASATGVVALMLSANPQLTWNQVRDILRTTAIQIDASPIPQAPNAYDPVTGHSPWYGHGRISALLAVNAALTTPPGLLLSITTSGLGDVQLTVSRAFPLGELFIPISTNTQIPIGSGPVLGLDTDALNWLFLPLHAAPAHVLANSQGTYSFSLPLGSLPPLLQLDAVALSIRWLPFEYRLSDVRRVTF